MKPSQNCCGVTNNCENGDEPSHAREWRWPVGYEIKVNSRHPVMRVVRPQIMTTDLPDETDFDPYHGDLDAQCAWRNFGGLTLEEASVKFEECPETYQEDFMFMGGKAFAFYFPVIDRFLRTTIELPEDQRGDRQSWIIPQCIKNQFEGRGSRHVRHLSQPVLSLCDFMLENIDLFVDDWSDVTEIQTQWHQLKQTVGRSG